MSSATVSQQVSGKAIAPAPKSFVDKINTDGFRVILRVRVIEMQGKENLFSDGTAEKHPGMRGYYFVKWQGYERSGLVFHRDCTVFQDKDETSNWVISHISGFVVTSSALEYYARSPHSSQKDCPRYQMWNMFRSLTCEDWSSLNIKSQPDLKRLKAATDTARLYRLG